MAGYYKTEAVVLRSLRLREADRIVHLYTGSRGRVGAVVKGIRRARSRFGGRLEPFIRLRLVLYEGRGELHTVTQAESVEWYPRLRERGASLHAAGAACEAVLRLFQEGEPNVAAYNLLCRELRLLDAEPCAAGTAGQLAFRLKLLLAAGFLPELARCARCGNGGRPSAAGGSGAAANGSSGRLFSAAAGGVVCRDCAGGEGFELGAAAHSFMSAALAAPLREAPDADPRALVEVDRALSGTLEYHANVRLRRVAH